MKVKSVVADLMSDVAMTDQQEHRDTVGDLHALSRDVPKPCTKG